MLTTGVLISCAVAAGCPPRASGVSPRGLHRTAVHTPARASLLLRGGAVRDKAKRRVGTRSDARLVAYAPVGRSGDFGRRASDDKPAEGSEDNPVDTWVLACGLGWLYGLGCIVGPFFGVGVGVVFPTGVVAGAGAGVGVVIGIGMGGGGVWGSGRGAVRGFRVGVPMSPPKLPESRELAARARAAVDALSNARGLVRERLRAVRSSNRTAAASSGV